MELQEVDALPLEKIKDCVKEIVGPEICEKVTSPSITWKTHEQEMTQYFESVTEPINTQMRKIYNESSVPTIEKEIQRANELGCIDSEIVAFKKCLEEQVTSIIKIPGGILSEVIQDRMNGQKEQADEKLRGFLYWFTNKGPQELMDVKGIFKAVYEKARKETAPPPGWEPSDAILQHGTYIPPESDYVHALKVLERLIPASERAI